MLKPAPDYEALKARLAGRDPLRVEKPDLLQTAVALILAPGAHGLEALFIRRAEREGDPWSGHIGLPGGRREPTDLDLLATAMRETEEEVGVLLPAAHLLGPLDDLHPRTPRLPQLVIRPFVFGLPERPAATLSDEVAEVIWLPLNKFESCHGTSNVSIAGKPTDVECYNARGLVIWGLTYRILRGFLPLVA